jgi:hypothetical protein
VRNFIFLGQNLVLAPLNKKKQKPIGLKFQKTKSTSFTSSANQSFDPPSSYVVSNGQYDDEKFQKLVPYLEYF